MEIISAISSVLGVSPPAFITGTVFWLVALGTALVEEFLPDPVDTMGLTAPEAKSVPLSLELVMSMAKVAPHKWTLEPGKIIYNHKRVRIPEEDVGDYLKFVNDQRAHREVDLQTAMIGYFRQDIEESLADASKLSEQTKALVQKVKEGC